MDFDLRFLGDWSLTTAIPFGLALSAFAWRFYRRETRLRADSLSWLLPTLRALAIFLLFLILTGPVLHRRETVGDLARLLILADASKSMTITDEQMDTRRKLLIAAQLGWLDQNTIDPAFRAASAEASRMAKIASQTDGNLVAVDARNLAREMATAAEAAMKSLNDLRDSNWPDLADLKQSLRKNLADPARKLADNPPGRDTGKILQSLRKIAREAEDWNARIIRSFDARVAQLVEDGDSRLRDALTKFDTETRWNRVRAHLLEGDESLFSRLNNTHEVELSRLVGSESDTLWVSGADQPDDLDALFEAFQVNTNDVSTDLSSALRKRTADVEAGDNVAAVLISDGRHNMGDSPENLARILGNRGIKVFTLSMGTAAPPEDLAIVEIDAPDSVFHESRAKGSIRIADNMESGQPFTVSIEREGRTVWQKELKTERNPSRSIPYDFPIKDLVSGAIQSRDDDLKLTAVPLDFQVRISELAGEKDASNNQRPLRFAAITEKPRMLILEGRPRWEFRYLRNALERDESWDVNALLAGGGGEERPWRRGKVAGTFPDDLETLYSYHLIVFGDVPMTMLKTEELEWLHNYVENRGGGIIFLDGRRTPLAFYRRTPLGNLLPVEWRTGSLSGNDIKLKFTAGDSIAGPISLVAGAEQNKRLWENLRPPRFVAPAQALPGSEVLLKAVMTEREADAMVFRRQGAGQVLYIGHDESWRWRYGIGDLYHQKFWNQAARWIMEPSFPVEDKHVALDTGPLMYNPGDQARVRVRLRDAEGRLILRANTEAQIFRDGEKVASVALEADANSGGVFRGQTAPLTEGDYEVRIRVDGLPEDQMKARTFFTVQAGSGGEMAILSANEELLRNVAANSGARFFREEEIDQLTRQLKPLSKGRIEEMDMLLWQSYWWFVPIILLLTLEWALRKRAGML